jgi:RNA-splicing ligase RtcB
MNNQLVIKEINHKNISKKTQHENHQQEKTIIISDSGTTTRFAITETKEN